MPKKTSQYNGVEIPSNQLASTEENEEKSLLKIPTFNLDLSEGEDSRKELGGWEKIPTTYQDTLAQEMIKRGKKQGRINDDDVESLHLIRMPQKLNKEEKQERLKNLKVQTPKKEESHTILASGSSILKGNDRITNTLTEPFKKDHYQAGIYGSNLLSSCYVAKGSSCKEGESWNLKVTDCEGSEEEQKEAIANETADGHGKIGYSTLKNALPENRKDSIKAGDCIQFRMLAQSNAFEKTDGGKKPRLKARKGLMPFTIKGTLEVKKDEDMPDGTDLILDKSQMKGWNKQRDITEHNENSKYDYKNELDLYLPTGNYKIQGQEEEPSIIFGIREKGKLKPYSNSYQNLQGNSKETIEIIADNAEKEAEFINHAITTPQELMNSISENADELLKIKEADDESPNEEGGEEDEQTYKSSAKIIATADKHGITTGLPHMTNERTKSTKKILTNYALKGANRKMSAMVAPNYNLKNDETYIPGLKRRTQSNLKGLMEATADLEKQSQEGNLSELKGLMEATADLEKQSQEGNLSEDQNEEFKRIKKEKDLAKKIALMRYPIVNAATGRQLKKEIQTEADDLSTRKEAGVNLSEDEEADLERYQEIIAKNKHRKGTILANPKSIEFCAADYDADILAFQPNDENEQALSQARDIEKSQDPTDEDYIKFKEIRKRDKIDYSTFYEDELKKLSNLDEKLDFVFIEQTDNKIGIRALDQAYLYTAEPLNNKTLEQIENLPEGESQEATELYHKLELKSQVYDKAELQGSLDAKVESVNERLQKGEINDKEAQREKTSTTKQLTAEIEAKKDEIEKTQTTLEKAEKRGKFPTNKLKTKADVDEKLSETNNNFNKARKTLLNNIGPMLQMEVDTPKSAERPDKPYENTINAIEDFKSNSETWDLLKHRHDRRVYTTAEAPETNTKLNPLTEATNKSWNAYKIRNQSPKNYQFIFEKEPKNCSKSDWMEWQDTAKDLIDTKNELIGELTQNKQNMGDKAQRNKIEEIYNHIKNQAESLTLGEDEEDTKENRKLLCHALWKAETQPESPKIPKALKDRAKEISKTVEAFTGYEENYKPLNSLKETEAYIIKVPFYTEEEGKETSPPENWKNIVENYTDNYEAVTDEAMPTINFALLDPDNEKTAELIEQLESWTNSKDPEDADYISIHEDEEYLEQATFTDKYGDSQKIDTIIPPQELTWVNDRDSTIKSQSMLSCQLFPEEVAEQIESLDFDNLRANLVSSQNGDLKEELAFFKDTKNPKSQEQHLQDFTNRYGNENGDLQLQVLPLKDKDHLTLNSTPAIYLEDRETLETKRLGFFAPDQASLPVNTSFSAKLELQKSKSNNKYIATPALKIDNNSIKPTIDKTADIENLKRQKKAYRNRPNKTLKDLTNRCNELLNQAQTKHQTTPQKERPVTKSKNPPIKEKSKTPPAEKTRKKERPSSKDSSNNTLEETREALKKILKTFKDHDLIEPGGIFSIGDRFSAARSNPGKKDRTLLKEKGKGKPQLAIFNNKTEEMDKELTEENLETALDAIKSFTESSTYKQVKNENNNSKKQSNNLS